MTKTKQEEPEQINKRELMEYYAYKGIIGNFRYYFRLLAGWLLQTAAKSSPHPGLAVILQRLRGVNIGNHVYIGSGINIDDLYLDGAMIDAFNLVHGFWEAKDTSDDLDKEVNKKFAVGYPKDNVLFQAPNRIVIWQDGNKVFDEEISKSNYLIEALRVFSSTNRQPLNSGSMLLKNLSSPIN